MNWLGAGFASFLVSLLAALLGGALHFEGQKRGVDLPPIVALTAGIAAAMVSRSRSGLRGLLVGSLAVWAAASAEVLATPHHGFVLDIHQFHERLKGARVVSFLACIALGFFVASRAWLPLLPFVTRDEQPARPKTRQVTIPKQKAT